MRALTDEETRVVFEKLSKFVGENLRYLVERPDGSYCFRLHRGRVYYVKEALMKWATNIGRKNLISMGVCVGKFTKSKKFHMQITALDVIQSYSKFKMWIKPNAEQAFLYGNHVSKSGLGRVTENMVQYQGVLLYSMSDIPLGFGVTSKTTQECRRAEPATVIAFHQADTGEYIRSETTLV